MSAKKKAANKSPTLARRGRPQADHPAPPSVIEQRKAGEVDTATLASLFNMTSAGIGNLEKNGIIPKIGKNKYHLARSIRGYVEYLQRARSGDPAKREEMDESKLKKIQAEAAILEHKLAVQKGDFVSFESMLAEGQKLGLVIRGMFQRVESDLTPRLAGRDAAEVSVILRDYMRAKLVELSQYESTVEIPTD